MQVGMIYGYINIYESPGKASSNNIFLSAYFSSS
jgi:hypothetical protein